MAALSSIAERLDLARGDLLDLGLRNTLLNYRTPKSRGAEIIDADAPEVFKWLVTERRTLSFLPTPEKETDAAKDRRNGERRARAIALQTTLADKSLQTRLLATYYAAKTHIEERGANILYLAIGMLHWFEDESSNKELRAPLLLVPVALERTSAREKFTLRYNEEDVEGNLSLATKLKTEFGIGYPAFPDLEDLDVGAYLKQIAHSVNGMARWSVAEIEISLGFFSFGKFLMYRDLASENWCTKDNPDGTPILAAMIRDGFREEPSPVQEDTYLDKHIAPDALHQIVDADSSQALALLDVRNNHNLVIQGPPGTGKSQTITNIIADALGQGKKVLFVAEKMAALDVVKRRLDKAGLGDACLELHSNTANKKAVLEELKRTVSLGKPKMGAVRAQLELYKQLRDRLNAYCLAVNTQVGDSGYTPYQLIGELVANQRALEGAAMPQPLFATSLEESSTVLTDIRAWNRTAIQQKEVLVGNLQSHLALMGVPDTHPFKDSQLLAMLPSDRQLIAAALSVAIDSVKSLDCALTELSSFMGIQTRGDKVDAEVLCKAAMRALQAPNLDGIELRTGNWQIKRDQVAQLLDAGERHSSIRQTFDAMLIAQAWMQDLFGARQLLNTVGRKWWRFLSGEYRRVRIQISGLCNGAQPKDVAFQLRVVDAVMEASRLEQSFREHEHLGAALFGVQWQGLRSEWSVLRRISDWMVALHRDVGDGKLPHGIIDFLAGNPALDSLKGKVGAVERTIPTHERALLAVFDELALTQTAKQALMSQNLSSQIAVFSHMLVRLDDLQDQITFNNLCSALGKEGLSWVVDTARGWDGAAKNLVHFFRHTCFETLLRCAYEEREALRTFDGASHENIRKQFQELDASSLHFTRLKLVGDHWRNLPTLNENGQLGILLWEFEKKSRHLPIRKLIETAGNAIQAIKPVLMMSPMSVATFLSPRSLAFDLVIFDEASQVKPVDAFGAIVRGKQVVVVGDRMQLPPTSFFDTLVGDDDIDPDEEQNLTSDMESILGLMAGQGAPQRMLRWHYRSRHESLIALSNKEFYDSSLVVFPSPSPTRRGFGLIFHHLPDTAYDRGKSRTNQKEAEALAKAVMQHAKTSPNMTLGVAAFSLAQTEAILQHLERLRSEDPTCEAFFAAHPFEPFFVKNLESVQGDERDVIFISIGYGRTEERYVSMSFGALNNVGGERRLNVLITRARLSCEVFTNLTHEDIDLSRTQSRGVAVLKAFLKYAQTGIVDVPDVGGGDPDSPFEEEVACAIEQLGYKVALQVGSAGFRIDMAIIDPSKPGRYLLGVECDGAAYHSSRSARDRDRLRQQVLENLGWRIHRIWSKDWFSNPSRELKRVLQAIEEAKSWIDNEMLQPAQTTATESVEVSRIARDPSKPRPVEKHLKAKDYEICNLTVRANGQDLHKVPAHRYSSWIAEIVAVESPVHIDDVARRIADGAAIKRIGNRIETAFQAGVAHAVRAGKVDKRGDFLWLPGMGIPPIRDRSMFPSASRKIELIAPEEMAAAIRKVVESSYGIDQEDVAPAVCRLLGFARTSEEMMKSVNKVMAKLIKTGHLSSVDGHVLDSLKS